jgi:hypothetical protein
MDVPGILVRLESRTIFMVRESTLRDEAQVDAFLRRALRALYDREPPPTAWATLAARLARPPAPPILPRSTNTAHPGLLFIPELLLAG